MPIARYYVRAEGRIIIASRQQASMIAHAVSPFTLAAAHGVSYCQVHVWLAKRKYCSIENCSTSASSQT